MDKFNKFMPLVKVEEQANGDLYVYGIVTAEVPDQEKEVCHYATTVPFYKAVNEEFEKATAAAGIEKSIMPLRSMHQLDAVGCGKDISFDDANKTIRMGFSVVDKAAAEKVRKGVFTGFSQGGQYVRKWERDGINFYTANPGEVSLVDSPCLQTAHFEYVKADGARELRKFANTEQPKFTEADAALIAAMLRKTLEEQPLAKEEKTKRKGGKDLHASDFAYVGDAEEPSTWKLPVHDAAHARNALARFNQTEGIPADKKAEVKSKIVAAAKKHGISVSDEAEKISKAIKYLQIQLGLAPLEKGLWQVCDMAQVVETLAWLQTSALYERDLEGDASTQPEDLETLLGDAISCLTAMVEEETEELRQRAAALSSKGAKAMTEQELQKAAAELVTKAKSANAHLKELGEHLDKMHKAHGSGMDNCKESLGKCMKALGGEEGVGGEGPVSTTITTAGDGAHSASKSFVAIGETADGVKIFKAVEPAPSGQVTREEIATIVNDGVGTAMKAMLEGFFGSPEGGDKKVEKGLGDRSLVRSAMLGPHATQPINKSQDTISNPGAPSGVNEPLTEDEVRKAAGGDVPSMVKLARATIKPMDDTQAAGVQANIAMARSRT